MRYSLSRPASLLRTMAFVLAVLPISPMTAYAKPEHVSIDFSPGWYWRSSPDTSTESTYIISFSGSYRTSRFAISSTVYSTRIAYLDTTSLTTSSAKNLDKLITSARDWAVRASVQYHLQLSDGIEHIELGGSGIPNGTESATSGLLIKLEADLHFVPNEQRIRTESNVQTSVATSLGFYFSEDYYVFQVLAGLGSNERLDDNFDLFDDMGFLETLTKRFRAGLNVVGPSLTGDEFLGTAVAIRPFIGIEVDTPLGGDSTLLLDDGTTTEAARLTEAQFVIAFRVSI